MDSPLPPSPVTPDRSPTSLAILFLVIWATATLAVAALGQQPSKVQSAITEMFTWRAFGDAAMLLLFLALFGIAAQLWTDGSLEPLGLPIRLRGARSFLGAIGLGVLCFVGLEMLLPTLIGLVRPDIVNLHPDVLANTIPDLSTLLMAVLITTVAGGLREELWRVIFLRAFERVGGDWGLKVGTLIGSVAFGLMHAYQGTIAIVVTAIFGLTLALRWRARRDLLELVIIHTSFDLCVVLFIYLRR